MKFEFSTTSTWHSIEIEDDSFVEWDIGLSWRPLQWLGLSGAINNLGSPQTAITPERLLLGGGFSLLDNRLQVGIDYVTNTKDLDIVGNVQSTLRIRPMKGLGIQLQALNLDEIGVGLQLGYGLGEVGGYANTSSLDDLSLTHTSGINDQSLWKKGRRIATFTLDGGLPTKRHPDCFQASEETYLSFLRRLHKASETPVSKGIFLQIEQLGLSTAQIEEVRSILLECRESGKKGNRIRQWFNRKW